MNNQELRIEVLLEEVVRKRASDLHLQVGLPPNATHRRVTRRC
jgi:twitching motility protein PilT